MRKRHSLLLSSEIQAKAAKRFAAGSSIDIDIAGGLKIQ
jgi:hypothetical protein